jgi:hypothetical protein
MPIAVRGYLRSTELGDRYPCRHSGGGRNPERHWMPAPVPDPDPGFTGMTEWLPDTYLCAAVLVGGSSIVDPAGNYGNAVPGIEGGNGARKETHDRNPF